LIYSKRRIIIGLQDELEVRGNTFLASRDKYDSIGV